MQDGYKSMADKLTKQMKKNKEITNPEKQIKPMKKRKQKKYRHNSSAAAHFSIFI